MHQQVVFCVFLTLILGVFQTCADESNNRRFVIFQPGEFFDPFTEKDSKNSRQHSASAIFEPNLIFGGSNNIFSAPFRHLSKPTGHAGHPRAIGYTSGNADKLNAQLRQPNNFFDNFANYNILDTQYKPKTAELKNPQKQEDILETNLKPPLRPQLKDIVGLGKIVNVQPTITYSEHQVTPSKEVLTAKDGLLPAAKKNLDGQSSYSRSHVTKPSVSNAQSSNTIGQASELVAHSDELKAHPYSHSTFKSAGAGKHQDSGHQGSFGDNEVKNYKSNHHHNKEAHEKHNDYHKESNHKEKEGNNKKHHDEAGHYKKHHEGKKSHKAAKFGEKKGHKKGHKTKGYHNKFHRDEYHREHRFYDDAHKEGYHEKNGDSHSHYKKNEGRHKNGSSHKSGRDSKKHGEKGFSKKYQHEDENKGFSREGGRKKYRKHHSDNHRKHKNIKGKQYGYHHKH